MNKKIGTKKILLIASTLFGMTFGAGNLIFPVHLGQMAGSNIVMASIGFFGMAVVIPVISIISIGISESKGLFSLCSKASKKFAYFFTTLLYLTISPFFVMPRSSSISFNSGFADIFGAVTDKNIAFLIFSFIFFLIVMCLSLRPSGITIWVGKIINPVFLIFLGFLLILALFNPMGSVFDAAPSVPYDKQPMLNGFIEGYNTMDALAGLAFGIIVINIVKDMGVKTSKDITKYISIAGIASGGATMLIYILTIIMGAQSLGLFELSSNGSIALSQISNHYFGIAGNLLLATIVTLASIKTSIGLVTSCSSAFVEMYPKTFSYKIWVVIFILISFLISNIGLDTIISFSTPVLFFISPIAIVLIALAIFGKYFDNSKMVHSWTIGLTLIPAIFYFLDKMPDIVMDTVHLQFVAESGRLIFPFYDSGFGWVIPAMIGFGIGVIRYRIKKKELKTN